MTIMLQRHIYIYMHIFFMIKTHPYLLVRVNWFRISECAFCISVRSLNNVHPLVWGSQMDVCKGEVIRRFVQQKNGNNSRSNALHLRVCWSKLWWYICVTKCRVFTKSIDLKKNIYWHWQVFVLTVLIFKRQDTECMPYKDTIFFL